MGKKQFKIDTVLMDRPQVKDYDSLTEEVREFVNGIIKDAVKANPILRHKGEIAPKHDDMFSFTWSEVIELRDSIDEKDIVNIFKIVYGIEEKDYMELDLFNSFSTYKWIEDQLEIVRQTEERELSYELTAKEKNAGVEDLKRFGYYVSLDSLTKGDKTKDEYYLNLTYAEIFRKLCLDKKNAEIRENLMKS